MTQTTLENLTQIRQEFKDYKIVFCSGSFDLTHVGHILFFEDCKKFGDILIVGVGDDKSIKELKGASRPILNEHIRLKTVDSFKPVDYCLLNTGSSNNPFYEIKKILEILRPDFYVVNEDAFDISIRQEFCKKYDMELKILKRQCPEEYEKISSTKIIEKIKKLD